MPCMFLVTGGSGFIGSHVVERLLRDGHRVRVLDNFSSGSREHLAFASADSRLEVVEGDLRDFRATAGAARGVEVIFHQAAMRSVPRSVDDPRGATENNITGTLNLLLAARDAGARRLVYASSSSVYGDEPSLPKREDHLPAPISPYAASKLAGEHYCRVFAKTYG